MNLSSMDNMSDRLLNECKTSYVGFKEILVTKYGITFYGKYH